MRSFFGATLFAVAVLATTAVATAQEGPLTLTAPYAIRELVGPNVLNRMEAGEFMRLGVFVNHSERPTVVTASQGERVLDLAFYSGPILEDLFQATVPFEATMVGPWMMTITRGTETATTEAPGIATLFALPLVPDIAAEKTDAGGVLSWTWPDLSEAQGLGLTILTTIMVTQEDNYDEYVLNFGLRDNPITVGAAGERFTIAIPEGELEEGKLFLFRVIMQFRDANGNVMAESLSFAEKVYSPA
ncbi:MAG: hypothetical protein ACWA6X_01495 [Bauldia sp.]